MELLRKILLGIAVVVVAGILFVVGAEVGTAVSKKTAIPAEKNVEFTSQTSARDLVEKAMASRFYGKLREALEQLEEARRWDVTMRGVDYQFALTYFDLRDYEQAEEKARRSIRRNEEISNAHALLALIYLVQAQDNGSPEVSEDRVMKNVHASRLADPLNPMPHYVLAEFYRAIGRPDLAVTAYRRALERVSKSDGIIMSTVKAGLAGLRNNHDANDPPFEPVLEDGEAPPEQFFFAAADALLRKDKERAVAHLEQARKQVSADVFQAIIEDSFFQDYLVSDSLLKENNDPSP